MRFNEQGLAWNQASGEQRRLRAITVAFSVVFLALSLVISLTRVPEPSREEQETLPPQLARLVIEKQKPPKQEVVKKEPEPEPEEPEKKPEPKEEPKPQVAEKAPEKPKATPDEVEKAREKARNSGILAMSNQLSKLNDLAEKVQLDRPDAITAKPLAPKGADHLAKQASRAAPTGGVDEDRLNRETREMALGPRQVAKVDVPTSPEGEGSGAVAASEGPAKAQRSRESLRRTMDANKGAIYSIYNRALRKKPSLRGRITPELVIAENGQVKECQVVESTLNEPRLEQKICNRLRLVNFGEAPGVEVTTIRYPIELLPG